LDGFLTRKTDGAEVTAYGYASRGELLRVDLPDGRTIEYVHDPLGRRIAKKIDGTIVEKYLWSGRTALLAVFDGANNLLMRFEYADGRMPVAMTRGGARYYLAYDQVGTLRLVTDSTGAVVKQIDYDTFGNVVGDTNPSFSVPFGFAGGLHDRDTGLVRFGYRDYDPETGRWTAKDPILFAGGDLDLYGYCLNDPVNNFDFEGLDTIKLGGSVRFPSLLVEAANKVFEIISGESLYDPCEKPQGLSTGLAFSFPGFLGGEWDAGGYFAANVGGEDVGFGRGSLDLGYQKGSVKDLADSGAFDVSAHWGLHGGTINFDSENQLSGATYNLGLGYYTGLTASMTATWSIKHQGINP
jgi:RHS repeat-associated protein